MAGRMRDRVCTWAAGCDRPARTRDLCAMHYNITLRAEADECSYEGCTRPQRAKGLCTNHYNQDKRSRNKRDKVMCTNGCDKPQHANGLCHVCYNREWYNSPEQVERRAIGKPNKYRPVVWCVNGCGEPQHGKGLCARCYKVALAERREGIAPLCENGCEKPQHAKGLCHVCYNRELRASKRPVSLVKKRPKRVPSKRISTPVKQRTEPLPDWARPKVSLVKVPRVLTPAEEIARLRAKYWNPDGTRRQPKE